MQVITGFHRMYISHITLCISEIINGEQKSNLASNCNHAHECCGELWASVGALENLGKKLILINILK